MIPSDMTPPPVITEETRKAEMAEEYVRGVKDGRMEAIERMLQAMKCQSKKHPPECGCVDEIEWLRERLNPNKE